MLLLAPAEGRDENQRQSRAPFGANPFDGSGCETERFGDGRVRVGTHRQARGRPIRPRGLHLEGRDLAEQRHTVERRGILLVNEAPPAAGPHVGDSGAQHEPDHEPDDGGPFPAATGRFRRLGGERHGRVLRQVDLLIDQLLRPLAQEVRSLGWVGRGANGIVDARDGVIELGRDGGGPYVVKGLEQGVGAGLGDRWARGGEHHTDNAGPVCACGGAGRRGDA